MRKNYKQLFQGASQLEPPNYLYGNIISRISLEKRHAARVRLWFLVITAIISLAAFVPAFQYAMQEFYQTGFYQYLSLIFSDGGTVLAYWKEYSLSLAESLPVFGTVVVLAIVFVFLEAIKHAAENIHDAFFIGKNDAGLIHNH